MPLTRSERTGWQSQQLTRPLSLPACLSLGCHARTRTSPSFHETFLSPPLSLSYMSLLSLIFSLTVLLVQSAYISAHKSHPQLPIYLHLQKFSLYPREPKRRWSRYKQSRMGGGIEKNTSAAPSLFDFEDLLPVMADKLGEEGLMRELCNGFQLLMDKDRGVITLDSLRRNSALLGLQDLRDDELSSMLREGDFDGDGALSEMEFCVLMFRLSPELMEQSRAWLDQALEEELFPQGS